MKENEINNYIEDANFMVAAKLNRYKRLSETMRDRTFFLDTALIRGKAGEKYILYTELIEGKVKIVLCDSRNVPMAILLEGRDFQSSEEYAFKDMLDKAKDICEEFFAKSPQEQDMSSLSYMKERLREIGRFSEVREDVVEKIQNKEEAKNPKKITVKEDEEKEKTEDENKVKNLKGKIHPYEAVSLKTIAQGYSLYDILQIEQTIGDKLPEGVSMEDVKNGWLTRVDTKELNKVLEQDIKGNVDRRRDDFVIQTASGQIIPFDEKLLRPVNLEPDRTDEEGININNDASITHGKAKAAMYEIPGKNPTQKWYLSTSYVEGMEHSNVRNIEFVQVNSANKGIKDQPENTVSTELLVVNPRRTYQNSQVRKSLEDKGNREVTNILENDKDLHQIGCDPKVEPFVKACENNDKIKQMFPDEGHIRGLVNRYARGDISSEAKKLVEEYFSANVDEKKEILEKFQEEIISNEIDAQDISDRRQDPRMG